jgi:lauroyl/myristoyl acyltransferase
LIPTGRLFTKIGCHTYNCGYIARSGLTALDNILQKFINSRVAMAIGLGLSSVPPRVGYGLANWIGSQIAKVKSNPMVRGVRANQWVIHGESITARELDEAVAAIFRSSARSLYEFWHFHRDPQAVLDMVEIDPSFSTCFRQAQQSSKGLLMVIPHLSNFDLVGRATVLNGYPLHILSYPQPSGGYRLQNRLRAMPGLTVTPLSIESLREASVTLRSGGTVLTGADRPLAEPDIKYRPRFFGRAASLPVFYVRLALKHHLPVVVTGGLRKPDGGYLVWASDPIPMVPHPDLVQETVQNAEVVLAVLAKFIQRAKDQWAMFYPIWPEVLDEMPA